MMNWKFKKSITDGEPYLIHSLNIWDYSWKNAGEKIKIKAPLYNQDFTFNVFEIQSENKTIQFSAVEFSNNIWGIYEVENENKK